MHLPLLLQSSHTDQGNLLMIGLLHRDSWLCRHGVRKHGVRCWRARPCERQQFLRSKVWWRRMDLPCPTPVHWQARAEQHWLRCSQQSTLHRISEQTPDYSQRYFFLVDYFWFPVIIRSLFLHTSVLMVPNDSPHWILIIIRDFWFIISFYNSNCPFLIIWII